VPKARCALPELYSHLCRTHRHVLGEYDTAFLFFPIERVLQNERLISRHFGCQTDQSAMGADHQSTGPFGKGLTQFLRSVSNDGNAKDEPLATSFLAPGHLSFRAGVDQILAEFQFLISGHLAILLPGSKCSIFTTFRWVCPGVCGFVVSPWNLCREDSSRCLQDHQTFVRCRGQCS
jgi:hypothetical protein